MTATGEAVSPGNARSLALLMLGTEESAHHRSRGEIVRLPSSRAGQRPARGTHVARDSGREGDARGHTQAPRRPRGPAPKGSHAPRVPLGPRPAVYV